MDSTHPQRNPIEEVAEEFMLRRRHGETPTIEEFVQRYPDHADEIRELFPTLRLMANVRDDVVDEHCERNWASAVSLVGHRLGDYRILREIGRGGMGIVYEAEQESLSRRVALKVLSPESVRSSLERFQREARAAANLQHTNIVPVFGVGQEQGLSYYVMQFIHGRGMDEIMEVMQKGLSTADKSVVDKTSAAGLAAALETGQTVTPAGEVDTAADRLSTTTAVRRPKSGSTSRSSGIRRAYFYRIAEIGADVADALAYAHQRGVLHRDIKPSNLLFDVVGNVWVTDFGLAKIEGEKDLTATGDVVGTLRYIAPESLRGQFDARGDIYGVGLTLYELVARRHAIDGSERGEVMYQITQEGPPRLSRDSAVPRDLETIISKAIEREPKDRYATAESLAADLRRFLRHEPVLARRIPVTTRLIRWADRNRGLATVSGVLLAGLMLAFVASLVVSSQLVTLTENLSKSLSISRQNEYAADINVAGFTITQIGELSVGLQLLDQLRPAPDQDDYRGWEWDYLRGLCRSDSIEALCDAGAPIYGLALTHDDRYLAVALRHGVQLWNLAERKKLAILHDTREFFCDPIFSPDGSRLLVAAANGSVAVHAVPELDKIAELNTNDAIAIDIEFSPDGKLLATAGTSRVFVWSYPDMKLLAEWPCRCITNWGGSLCFSPDGAQLIIYDSHSLTAYGTVKIRAGHGRASPPAQFQLDMQSRLCDALFSQNGNALLCVVDSQIEIRDPESGELRHRLTGHASDVKALCRVSGDRVCSTAADNSIRIWDMESGQQSELLRDLDETLSIVSMYRRAQVITGGIEGQVRLWDVDQSKHTPLKPYQVIEDSLGIEPLSPPVVTSDEKFIVHVTQPTRDDATGLTNHVELIPLLTALPRQKLLLDESTNLYTSVVTSPGGQVLFVGTGSGEIIVWSLGEEQVIQRIQAHESYPPSMEVDNAILGGAVVHDVLPLHGVLVTLQSREFTDVGKPTKGQIKFWCLDTWQAHAALKVPQTDEAVHSLSFSADEAYCAFKSKYNDKVDIWSLADGKLVRSIEGLGLDFSPVESDEFIVFQYGGDVDFYRMNQDEPVGSLRAHGGGLVSAVYLPNGKRLATASTEQGAMFRIWDVGTRRLMLTLPGVGERPTLQVSNQGNVILARTLEAEGGLINVWQALPGDSVSATDSAVPRPMQEVHRQVFPKRSRSRQG